MTLAEVERLFVAVKDADFEREAVDFAGSVVGARLALLYDRDETGKPAIKVMIAANEDPATLSVQPKIDLSPARRCRKASVSGRRSR